MKMFGFLRTDVDYTFSTHTFCFEYIFRFRIPFSFEVHYGNSLCVKYIRGHQNNGIIHDIPDDSHVAFYWTTGH